MDLPLRAILSKIQEHKKRIRGFRSLYNSVTPINKTLPVEVLMTIFVHIQPRLNRRRGMSILCVCRYWTAVLHNTSEFWANLLATYQDVTHLPDWKLDRLRMALNNSEPRPLRLLFRGLPVQLAELLCLHAGRIAELHVDIAKCLDGLNILLETDMRVIERLSITPP